MKKGPAAAELFHAEGRTDTQITKIAVTFCNFANAPKNQSVTAVQGNNDRSEIHTKHINIMLGLNINFLIVKHGAYSNR
jgi:predicted phosphodiesterase